MNIFCYFKVKVCLFIFLLTKLSFSISMENTPQRKGVLLSPYSYEDSLFFKNKREGSLKLSGQDKEEFVLGFLSDSLLYNEDLKLKKIKKEKPSEDIREYAYFYKETPVCHGKIKVVWQDGPMPFILGSSVLVGPSFEVSSDFNFLDNAKKIAKKYAEKKFKKTKEISFSEACFYYKEEKLVPSFRLKFLADGKPYEFIVSKDKILKEKALFFFFNEGVKGEIQSYERNDISSDLKTSSYDFEGNGYLNNENFQTYLDRGAPNSLSRAYSKTNQFVYVPEDPRFKEASMFAHAENMRSFFLSLGYEEWQEKRMILKAYSLFGASRDENNAMYIPFDDDFGGAPSISIGEGDGSILMNLLTDSDVLGHEYAHHIIYETLSSTSGVSLALHEGLADYFVFAKENSPCLGETICPKGSLGCFIYNKCLRTAANNLIYGEGISTGFDWHIEGQIVSGTLWDLRAQIEPTLFDKLVLKSTRYYIPNMGYYGFIASLMTADEVLYSGENQCIIHEAFLKRGFSSFLTDLSCENVADWPEAQGESYGEDYLTGSGGAETGDDEAGCGALGIFSRLNPKQTAFFFMFFFLSPFLIILLHKIFFLRRKQKVHHEEEKLKKKKYFFS